MGMNIMVSVLFPVIMVAPIVLFPRCVAVNLVPLHSPLAWSMFLISIIGHPILSFNRWFGLPELLIPLQNSAVNHSLWQTKSELKYSFSSPGISDIIYSLTCSTESSVGAVRVFSFLEKIACQAQIWWKTTGLMILVPSTGFNVLINFLTYL